MTEEKNNLSQTPKSWVWTNLREILDFIKGKKPKNLGAKNELLTIPYINIKAFEKKVIDKFTDGTDSRLCETSDILIVWDGARCGLVGRGVSGAIGSTLAKLVCHELNPSYLFHFLRLKYDYINKRPRGVGIPHVDPNIFWNITMPLPPLAEQGRIVSDIDELFTRLDAGVESLTKVKTQLQRYRQAVLKYAFEGKLTEEWRKTHKGEIEPTLIKNSHRDIIEKRKNSGKRTYGSLLSPAYEELPAIPTNWIWVRFEEVIYVIDYRGRTPPFCSEGIPHLRSSNIRDGKIIWENLKYVSEEIYQKYMVRGFPQQSDLLFTTEAPLGEVTFVPGKKFSIAQRVILLRPNKDLLDAKFLFYQLKSGRFRRRLTGKGTGTTVTGVSYRNLRQIELSIPPLGEQEKIVEEVELLLSMVDEAEKVVNQSLIQSERLRQGILKKAFEGRLVPQDPTDEPAEKLLERIIEEKEKYKSKEIRKRKSNRERGLKQLELVRYVN